ncbi:Gfo/Idh/MocA family oxidoreductase [bacterium]|nr:Gfo/Idh/MocA family oxidoreductase [bacterium]
MEKVRLVMAGTGRWGKNVLRNLVALDGCEVVKVFDSSEEGRANAREFAPGATLVGSFEDLFDAEPDGVVIAAPAEYHYALTKQALEQGCHVIVEKPLAMSTAEGEELVKLAATEGVHLMVGHVLRYHPALKAILGVIGGGGIGEVLTVHARRTNFGRVRTAENVVWSIAPHDIVNIALVMGEWPARVSCFSRANIRSGIADYAQLSLEFPSRRLALVHVSWLDPQKKRELTVIGDRGMLLWEDAAGTLELYPSWAEPLLDETGNPATAHHSGTVEQVEVEPGEPLAREMAHFVACCRGEETPESDGREGLAVLRVLEAADESARQGGAPVEVE